ncbi:hypothetical protein MMC11_003898 [Xylographa trunciseda]|nr:hypothetical protein [Xylographa trunciseda]
MLSLQLRQKCFLETMANQPQYHDYIRSITWSFVLPQPTIVRDDDEDLHCNFLRQIWRITSRLISIVHIDGSNTSYTQPRINRLGKYPGGLHIAPASLTLFGEMRESLAKFALKSMDPSRLVHLCLDRIQDTGFMNGHHGEIGLNGVQYLLYNVSLGAHGVITGSFVSLIGVCTALRSLTLRQSAEVESHNLLWARAKVQDLYQEWAAFIVSVKPTLRKFVFEHGRELERMKMNGMTSVSNMSSMEESFMKYLLPAISSGGWQCLEVMTIDGVQKLRALKNNPRLTRRKQLSESLGDTVTLVIDRNTTFKRL